MIRLKIDSLYVFDIDVILRLMDDELFEASVIAQTPEWMTSEEEIAEACAEVVELNKAIKRMNYDFEDVLCQEN